MVFGSSSGLFKVDRAASEMNTISKAGIMTVNQGSHGKCSSSARGFCGREADPRHEERSRHGEYVLSFGW